MEKKQHLEQVFYERVIFRIFFSFFPTVTLRQEDEAHVPLPTESAHTSLNPNQLTLCLLFLKGERCRHKRAAAPQNASVLGLSEPKLSEPLWGMRVQADLAAAAAWPQRGGDCAAVWVYSPEPNKWPCQAIFCSYSPADERAPFFSRKRLASDCAGRWVTLMTLVARQPTVRQKLILKIHAGCREPAGWFQGARQSDLQEADSDEYLEFL